MRKSLSWNEYSILVIQCTVCLITGRLGVRAGVGPGGGGGGIGGLHAVIFEQKIVQWRTAMIFFSRRGHWGTLGFRREAGALAAEAQKFRGGGGGRAWFLRARQAWESINLFAQLPKKLMSGGGGGGGGTPTHFFPPDNFRTSFTLLGRGTLGTQHRPPGWQAPPPKKKKKNEI